MISRFSGKIGSALFACAAMVMLFAGCGGARKNNTIRPDAARGTMLYRDALEMVEKGNFPSALARIDSAIAFKPGYANAYRIKGWILVAMDRPDSAISAYEKCLFYQSNFPAVQNDLGKLYLQTGHFEKASFYLKKAAQALPDSAIIQLRLVESSYHQDLIALAADHLTRYREMVDFPSDRYWQYKGLVAARQNLPEEAMDALLHYAEMRPRDPEAWKNLGMVRFENGRYDEAMSAFNKAGVLNPEDGEIYLYRARYFKVFNKNTIAWEQLHHAMNLDSSNVEVLFTAGKWYYEAGDLEKSREKMDLISAISPQYWPAYKYLGFLSEESGNPAEALMFYQRYLQNTFSRDEEVLKRSRALGDVEQ